MEFYYYIPQFYNFIFLCLESFIGVSERFGTSFMRGGFLWEKLGNRVHHIFNNYSTSTSRTWAFNSFAFITARHLGFDHAERRPGAIFMRFVFCHGRSFRISLRRTSFRCNIHEKMADSWLKRITTRASGIIVLLYTNTFSCFFSVFWSCFFKKSHNFCLGWLGNPRRHLEFLYT